MWTSRAFYTISGLVNLITGVGIITVLLLQNRRSRLVQLFVFFIAQLTCWSVFYFAWMFAADRAQSERLVRIVMICVALMPATFMHFASELTNQRFPRWFHAANHGLGAFFATQTFFPWFAPYGSPGFLFFAVWPYAGPLFYAHFAHFVANFLGAQLVMYRVLRVEQGIMRQRIAAVFWGNLVGVVTGATNFVPWFRDVWPALQAIPPIFPPFISLLVLVYGWAIIRHQLMDIEVVIKRTLVFAGLVGAVVMVVSLFTFLSQDLLAQRVQIPRIWSSMLSAVVIAAVYGRLRGWLVIATDRYLFQRRYDYKELLKKFSDQVIVTMDLQQVAESTVKTLTETIHADSCALLMLATDTRQYELRASKGLAATQLSVGEEEPFIVFLHETQQPIGLDGELGRVRFPEAVTNQLAALNARLCLPLHLHDRLIGVLCLGKKKSDEPYTPDDLAVLLPLSRTLAIAVANAQLVNDLSKTQAEAAQKEKLAVIGTLSAGINHEIRNPLGIVKTQCEGFLLDWQDGLLKDKPWTEISARCLSIMRSAIYHIDRATSITQKLSNFAKPIQEPDVRPVQVADEINEVLSLIGYDLTLEKIDVEKQMSPGLPLIVVDRRQIQEVLFNLIRNAAQAIKPPGTITIVATHGQDEVQIAIRDTGSGIASDHLQKIYDPFFTTKAPGQGTGLGLFIVRQLVERNRGRIVAKSALGEGTTFSLTFPAMPATAGATGDGADQACAHR